MNVRTLCLGILSLQEASGYEIKKDVEDGLFSHFIDASFGSIYPALTQLAAEGYVTVREEEQTGKPDKKVYAITDVRAECPGAGHLGIACQGQVQVRVPFSDAAAGLSVTGNDAGGHSKAVG